MADTFARRRDSLLDQLGSHGALVLAAAPELVIGRDTELRYVVDAELYYLTGYTEPEAVLVLAPAHQEARFTMFVRARDPQRELWAGRRGGVEAARERFGADAAHPVSELSEKLGKLVADTDVLFARLGTGRPELDGLIQRILAEARRSRPRTGRGPQALIDPGELLDDMRVIKDADEIALLRTAAQISAQSYLDVLPRIKPAVGEWEIEAALEYGFRARGADGAAFPSICAAGSNATVLHYVANSAQARAGELLLMDAGARYGMYCGDITRTVPVGGCFTRPQRDVYDVVLAAHDAAMEAVRPGASCNAPHEAATRVIVEGLVHLGLLQGSVSDLLSDEAAVKRYYPHRTSHWLGLEVHDVGAYARRAAAVTLQAGMVLTIEPGIYIPEDAQDVPAEFLGVGVRIEDDLLVTEGGHEILTAELPTDPDALLALQSGDRG